MYTNLGTAFVGLGILIFTVVISFILVEIFHKSRSKIYREYLTNLYVAARIRQLAVRDKIDLNEEDRNFCKYHKMSEKERMKDLDMAIEQELMDKIAEVPENK